MSIRETASELAHNPKVAAAVASVTTGTGAGTILDFIPDDIGKLATLVGLVLSVILIRTHLIGLKNVKTESEINKIEKEKSKIELQLLKEKAAKHGLEVDD